MKINSRAGTQAEPTNTAYESSEKHRNEGKVWQPMKLTES